MPLCEDRVTTWSPRGRLLRGNSGRVLESEKAVASVEKTSWVPIRSETQVKLLPEAFRDPKAYENAWPLQLVGAPYRDRKSVV